MAEDERYFAEQKAKKDRLREENKLFLKIQIEEAKLRREKEFREAKERHKTHFGPEEDELAAGFTKTREAFNKANILTTLAQQIESK